jgi:hypothetical protein
MRAKADESHRDFESSATAAIALPVRLTVLPRDFFG